MGLFFFPLQDIGSYELSSGTLAQLTLCKLFSKKIPPRLGLGGRFGTCPNAGFHVYSRMHKSKQLADCDSTPNSNMITVYDKGYIVSKKGFSYLFKTHDWKDHFEECT